MIEGLKLTFSGEELRKLLEARIDHHRVCADRWAHEKTRTPEDETEDAPLLPEHMCTNEAERHAWRADVLQFIRDRLEPAEALAWDHGLRGYDAVQLASAITWQEAIGTEILLATFDQQLWEAAPKAGLKAWPNTLPA